jgi:Zn-dependent membrane protease YugP
MSSYIILVVITMALGFGAQGYVNSQLKKHSAIRCSFGLTGYQVATGMLHYYGVPGVTVRPGAEGEDFFNPKDNTISLGPDSFNSTSITAVATACHEVGHACQHAMGYTPMKVRTAIVPVANFTQNTWIFLLLAGVILNVMGLVELAIAFYAVAVVFQLVTLPVEFDASKRALTYLNTVGMPAGEAAGAQSVLRACALTYVAAALVSITQLIYLLGNVRN